MIHIVILLNSIVHLDDVLVFIKSAMRLMIAMIILMNQLPFVVNIIRIFVVLITFLVFLVNVFLNHLNAMENQNVKMDLMSTVNVNSIVLVHQITLNVLQVLALMENLSVMEIRIVSMVMMN